MMKVAWANMLELSYYDTQDRFQYSRSWSDNCSFSLSRLLFSTSSPLAIWIMVNCRQIDCHLSASGHFLSSSFFKKDALHTVFVTRIEHFSLTEHVTIVKLVKTNIAANYYIHFALPVERCLHCELLLGFILAKTVTKVKVSSNRQLPLSQSMEQSTLTRNQGSHGTPMLLPEDLRGRE